MSGPSLLSIFNDQFIQLLEDIHTIFPDNSDVLTGKNTLITIRKTNPKLLIQIWLTLVYLPYKTEIDNGNVEFFINKDYSEDFDDKNSAKKKILDVIESIRQPIREMGESNQLKTMKYIQTLSKLAVMYSSQ